MGTELKQNIIMRILLAVKAFFGRFFSGIHQVYRRIIPKRDPKYYDGQLHQRKYLLLMAIASFVIYLYIETFARATIGLSEGLKYLIGHPVVFFYNCLILFTTMTFALLFRRRRFAFILICLVWISLGTVNGLILIKRMTPFTLYDLQILSDGLTIVTNYYSTAQIILIVAVIAILVVFLILILINSRKWENIDWGKTIGTIVACVVLTGVLTTGLLRNETLSTFFGNLNYAYRDYGFPYCFINTSVNTGISRPEDYSNTLIYNILKNDTRSGDDTIIEAKDDDSFYPNVIVLQMESFTIAEDYNHISVDVDPTPVFNELRENYSSGWFKVPACGAGTANTEFEVLTGISARFFGPGEYPYKGKLREQTLESMAYILKNHGFTTSALHDHRALFYNRNEVYANLGFDSYTSIEYMNNVIKTPTGWAKDQILTDNIIDIMKDTDSRDFMHVISVEGHGSYPTYQVFKDPYTTVTADDEDTKWKYEYYLNECHEMDTFIGDLIDELEQLNEPTIMLIYGDHIPALEVSEEEYGTGDLYETRYVIWDNFGLKKKDRDITSYEAGALMFSRIGLVGEGVIFDFQQTTKLEDDDDLAKMKALAYDMIYGENYVYRGRVPYKPVDMRMGYKEISISEIVKIGDEYYIRGKNFTEHSTVSMDGEVLDTVYLSPTLLGLREEIDPQDVAKLEVSQIDTKDDTVLTTIRFLEEL